MVEHPHVLEQPVLVQDFITIVTVVTTKKEVSILAVLFLAIGLKHLPVKKVSHVYTVLSQVLNIMHNNILCLFPTFVMLPALVHWRFITKIFIIYFLQKNILKCIFLWYILYTKLDNEEIIKYNHEYHKMNYKYITFLLNQKGIALISGFHKN